MPAFYKEFAGSVPDCTALPMLLDETAIDARLLTVVADKGFMSDEGVDAITDAGMHYIAAVRRGSRHVVVPDGISEYSDVFTFRGRSVHCRSFKEEGRIHHLYYDMALANAETTDLVLRSQKRNKAKEHRIEVEEERRRTKRKTKLTDMEQLEALRESLASPVQGLVHRRFVDPSDGVPVKARDLVHGRDRQPPAKQLLHPPGRTVRDPGSGISHADVFDEAPAAA